MGTINQLIKDLKAFPEKTRISSKKVLNAEAPRLIEELRNRSPEDTGEYKSRWHKTGPRFTSANVYASIVIKNADPKAGLMEYGSDPGSAPWYFPSARPPTGKLVESNGRIWAGGLNPGHALTIGGAIDPVIFSNDTRQLQIANAIADNIIRLI